MSTEERHGSEPRTDDHHQVLDEPDQDQKLTPKPEITDEHKAKAKEMAKAYDDQRPTTKMPGTGGAVVGTAVNEWIDDEGNPKFSDQNTENDN
ncbi:hypothetical protein [Mycolicibacterium sp. XJ1819]